MGLETAPNAQFIINLSYQFLIHSRDADDIHHCNSKYGRSRLGFGNARKVISGNCSRGIIGASSI